MERHIIFPDSIYVTNILKTRLPGLKTTRGKYNQFFIDSNNYGGATNMENLKNLKIIVLTAMALAIVRKNAIPF